MMVISKKRVTFLIVAGSIFAITILRAVLMSGGVRVVIDQRRLKGPVSAELVVYEYTDFQCPACAGVVEHLSGLVERYGGKVAVQHKYFPLPMHKNARAAALAADCAAEQGRFWPAHDEIFSSRVIWAGLEDPWYYFYLMAEGLGLNMQKFKACAADPAAAKRVEADEQEAIRLGIKATPTFVIGKDLAVGFDSFKSALVARFGF